MDGTDIFAVLTPFVPLFVQILRVVTFPPFSFSVRLRQLTVEVLRTFHPRPRMRGMDAHTQRQTIFLTSRSPFAHDIPFRPHVHGVPRLVLTVPKVEIIVVITQSHEITCPYALIETNQRIRFPLFRLPFVNHILETEIFRVTVLFYMHIILPLARIIHVAGIPVTRFRLTLRSPMRPNTELGIAEPVRTFISGQ